MSMYEEQPRQMDGIISTPDGVFTTSDPSIPQEHRQNCMQRAEAHAAHAWSAGQGGAHGRYWCDGASAYTQLGPRPKAPAVLTAHIESSAQAVRVMLYIPTTTAPDAVEVQYSALYEGAHMPPREAVATALRAVADQLGPRPDSRDAGYLTKDPPAPTGHRRADEWAVEEHQAAIAEGRGCWHCGAIAEGIAAQKRGHQLIYGTPYPEDYVWLGDLAGMEVVPVLREGPGGPNLQLRVTHRCGNEGVLMANMGMDGMSDDGAIMLGNLVEFAVKLREGHACPPHNPSPEHQARMQRWTDSASGGARPVVDREDGPQAGLLTNGPMLAVDLETEGQRLFRQGRHAETEIPLAREILGDEAAEQLAARPTPAERAHRIVAGRMERRRRLGDGPDCTPAVVEEPGGAYCACSDPDCPTPDGQYTHGTPAAP